jgi:DNA-binding NtrC family response regulator
MPDIYLVGEDRALLTTRAAVLRRTGRRVDFSDGTGVKTALAERRIGVVVLCHSLKGREALELAEQIRQIQPTTKVVLLDFDGAWGKEYEALPVDAVLSTAPEMLIEKINALLAEDNCGARSL